VSPVIRDDDGCAKIRKSHSTDVLTPCTYLRSSLIYLNDLHRHPLNTFPGLYSSLSPISGRSRAGSSRRWTRGPRGWCASWSGRSCSASPTSPSTTPSMTSYRPGYYGPRRCEPFSFVTAIFIARIISLINTQVSATSPRLQPSHDDDASLCACMTLALLPLCARRWPCVGSRTCETTRASPSSRPTAGSPG
jgi:hypothetical protein